ncbi:decaprenyl-phosphate phosphoribosyltransferase [Acinetobacter sp. C26M]|uniref:decaprenyl-phosphate phosphoribosyltransferase n=1 Tax=unclassified Acinetobacter TaxID=196816 RepID=UPI00203767A5|nr:MULTISPECIES: decaprenyl-phosphate phosphoribosyltransferase [unclassified Acinetobacter]USA46844.1 decaprenyl-phosphate phosphoribosyltransferase [Acinetobacter sp. C26M]USA50328.1 decaprenyl-phosphate phosphoribosyltransferase [Acinetobacter sp. C26G]
MSSTFWGLIKLCRPKQWIKNLFVLAPLLFSGLFTNLNNVVQAFTAMLLFCIASSATYILNDLKDIEKDRLHSIKSKTRPLASGILSIRKAKILMAVLYAFLTLAAFFVPIVIAIIMSYMLLNFFYSNYLKHQPLLDIFTIAIGFVLRVYAGAIAINVTVSSWMFITTLCLALYLASIKRRQELTSHGSTTRKVLEGYSLYLLNRYAEMSAIGALLFYSIFVMLERPKLVITIPLVIFGMFRYWYIIDIHNKGESPTDAILSDKQILFTGILWIIACIYGLLFTK